MTKSDGSDLPATTVCLSTIGSGTQASPAVRGNTGWTFNTGPVIEALFQDRCAHASALSLHLAAVGYLDALATAGCPARVASANYRVLAEVGGWLPVQPDAAAPSRLKLPCVPVEPPRPGENFAVAAFSTLRSRRAPRRPGSARVRPRRPEL